MTWPVWPLGVTFLLLTLCCYPFAASPAEEVGLPHEDRTPGVMSPCVCGGGLRNESSDFAEEAAGRGKRPLLCIGVRCMSKHRRSLALLLHSLLITGSEDMRIFLVDTGKPAMDLTPYAALANAIVFEQQRCWMRCKAQSGGSRSKGFQNWRPRRRTRVVSVITSLRREAIFARFPDLPRDVYDYGYIITDMLVDLLLSRRWRGSLQRCDYFLFTNSDNLYLPEFMPAVRARMQAGVDLIASHFISHFLYTRGDVWAWRPSHRFACRHGRDLEFHAQW
eukprot:RCo033592